MQAQCWSALVPWHSPPPPPPNTHTHTHTHTPTTTQPKKQVTEKKTGAGWVEHGRRKCSFSKARGCGKRGRTGRVDVRVNCSAWGGSGKPSWHRFLAFYLQNPDHLTKKAFASKDVARASTDRKHNTNKTKRQTGTDTQGQTERQRTQTERKTDRQT